MARTRSAAKSTSDDTPPQVQASPSTEHRFLPNPGLDGFKESLSRFEYSVGKTTTQEPGHKYRAKAAHPATTNVSPLKDRKRPISQNESSEPSPTKKRRESSKYAPPSKYAHLPKLHDVLAPDLICVFVGTNPGIRTATSGHAYAHPSNLFWKLLHSSGCTDRRCRPEEDVDLPRLYSMGNTNIVERPTKDAAELSKAEMAGGTPILEAKIRHFKPEAVCIVGKGIWEAVWRYKHGKNPTKEEFKYGWQDEEENMGMTEEDQQEDRIHGKVWKGAKVFVTSSTSGLSASLRPPEKEAIWSSFGQWVQARRKERADRTVE